MVHEKPSTPSFSKSYVLEQSTMASVQAQEGESKGVVNLFAGTEGIYHLPHHAKEIERLRKQHAFIVSSTGGVLVTAPLKQSTIKVLDSGAADGEERSSFLEKSELHL